MMDNLSTRYSSLDVDAMDGGARDKELHRLRTLRAEFHRRREERDRGMNHFRYADDSRQSGTIPRGGVP